FSATAYRPDAHTPAGVNIDLCAAMRRAAGGRIPVVLQGSVVEVAMAEGALADGTADLVEMTRAQIADPVLVAKVRGGRATEVRPCILCNQACRVRDNRNPLVSCVGEPRSGHETVEIDPAGPPQAAEAAPGDAVVVGAGVAGLECARVLALRGHRVRVIERSARSGGALRAAAVGPGRQRLADLADWLAAECARLGVTLETGRVATADDLDAARHDDASVVLATGGRATVSTLPTDGSVSVVDAATALAGGPDGLPAGPVVVHDTVGGPVAVGVAEWLAAAGRQVSFVTADQIAGTLLSLTGDLADANTRLQRAGIRRELRALVRRIEDGRVHLEDPWTGAVRDVAASVVVECGHRLADEVLYRERPGTPRAGDCVAPRTVLDAVLEGRRRALEICGLQPAGRTPITSGATP
ncbi:MAG TPA: FAD-dependent oxidoreductase, partial [Acidimicrobiales bacterium]